MARKQGYFGAMLGLAAMAVSGCALAQGAEKAGPISIYGNKTTFEIAPVLLAADRIYPGTATVSMGSLANLWGEAGPSTYSSPGIGDVATNAETQALRFSARHPDLRIIMTVSEGWYRIVARKSAGIGKVADLKGKRIATIMGTSSGYYLTRMLATAGLTTADVTVVNVMPLADMAKQLADKKVDAVTIWEPEIENAKRAIEGDVIELQDKKVYRELFNLNTTAANLADPEKRKKIVALVRSIITASESIRQDPKAAQALVVKASGYPADVVARSWPEQTFPAALAPDLLDVMTVEEQWLAGTEKRTPRTREQLATLIDASVLEEARRGR